MRYKSKRQDEYECTTSDRIKMHSAKQRKTPTSMASRACFISASRYSNICSWFLARFNGSKPTLPANSQSAKAGGHFKKGMDSDMTSPRCCFAAGISGSCDVSLTEASLFEADSGILPVVVAVE